jgi:hypothetical protein
MARTTVFLACFLVAACNAMVTKSDNKDDGKKAATTTTNGELDPSKRPPAPVTVGGDVKFEGYVQKAFAIKVNDVPFADSEDFYTRFIDELVLPKYEALADAKVTLEGAYGLHEFGKGASVFMSSMAADGHLFEAITDAQSKFTVSVKAAALDETFKARVVIRIGLEIEQPDAEKERYCYILHGNRDGILISENTKPIIFDDFKTQLNTYRCEDVKDSELVIPGASGDDSTDGGTSQDGTSTAEPHAKVVETIKIASPLDAREEGTNALHAIWMTGDGEIYVSKKPVKSLDDGRYYFPAHVLSGLKNTSVRSSYRLDDSKNPLTNPWFGNFVPFGSKLIATVYSWRQDGELPCASCLAVLSADGSTLTPEQTLPQRLDHEENLIPRSDSDLIYFSGNGVCSVDFSADKLLTCSKLPTSNKCQPYRPSTVWFKNAFYGTTRRCSYKIVVYNEAGVQQKTYSISKLDISSDDYELARIVTDGTSLYLVNLKGDDLIFRRLELVE